MTAANEDQKLIQDDREGEEWGGDVAREGLSRREGSWGWEKGDEQMVQLTRPSSSESQCEKVTVTITCRSMCKIVIGVHILSKWI